MPQSSARRRTRWASSAVSTSPSPAAGSSSSSTLGWVATARAMASSRRCPYGRSWTCRSEVVLEAELADRGDDLAGQRRSRPGRRGRAGTSRRSRGSEAARRLSSTVASSNSSSDWNERLSPARARFVGDSGRQLLAVEAHRAGRRPGEAGDGVDHRRLAGAVRADQTGDRARRHREATRRRRRRRRRSARSGRAPRASAGDDPLALLGRQLERRAAAASGRRGILPRDLPDQPRELVDRLLGDAVLVLQHQQDHEHAADQLDVPGRRCRRWRS